MLEITLIQDLAKKNLRTVPRNVLNLTNLKMLYLEGNDLEELPSELFILLDKLQWLDVRNNKLTTVPKTVMDHSSLETILLQNNDIEFLPLELGFVPNLKVLQLSGNPIKFPKKFITEAGVQAITKFLRNEYIAREMHQQLNEAEIELLKQSTSDDQSTITNDTYTKSQPEMPIITLKSFHRLNSRKQRTRTKKGHYKSRSKYSIYKDTLYSNSNKYVSATPTTRNEDRVQEQSMKDEFLKKMKELLFSQDETLQREKDREAMKKWRNSSKHKNKQPDVNYRPDVPFDYNNEYDRIPSRRDINTFIQKSTESFRSYKPKKINVEKLITDIVDSLKAMERERNIEKTPKAQMDYAGREIKRILDLQKRLSALKISNDRLL